MSELNSTRPSEAVNATRPIYVVYNSPTDHPGWFVVREWVIAYGDAEALDNFQLASNLEEARALIPPGLFCIARHPNDEPQIVETWI